MGVNIANLKLVKGGKKDVEQQVRLAKEEKHRLRLEAIRSSGDRALQNLANENKQTSDEDKTAMTKTMNDIIIRHSLKPSDYNWAATYSTYESFRAAFNRARCTSKSAAARRTSMTEQWIQFIGLTFEALIKKGVLTSKEQIAEEITEGTEYHVDKKQLSREQIIFRQLAKLSDNINIDQALVPYYLKTSQLRAKYYQAKLTFIECTPPLYNIDVNDAFSTLSDIFENNINEEILDQTPFELKKGQVELLTNTKIGGSLFHRLVEICNDEFEEEKECDSEEPIEKSDSVDEELDDETRQLLEFFDIQLKEIFNVSDNDKLNRFCHTPLISLTPEQWSVVKDVFSCFYIDFSMVNFYIDMIKDYLNPTKCLASQIDNCLDLSAVLNLLPHSLLGYYDYRLEPSDEYFVPLNKNSSLYQEHAQYGNSHAKISQNIKDCKWAFEDYGYAGFVFLVLFPDLNEKRMRPAIVTNIEGLDVSFLDETTLQKEDLRTNKEGGLVYETLLCPFNEGDKAEFKTIRQIVISENPRIKFDLESTAKQCEQNDQYIANEMNDIEILEHLFE